MKTYRLANPLERDSIPESADPEHHEIHDLQRALGAAGVYHGPIDGIFGAGTAGSCKQAKWRFGYPRRAVVATGGQKLYDFLAGKQHLPASYRIRRHARGYGISKWAKIRAEIVYNAHWGVSHTNEIHYAQIRPFPVGAPARTLPLTTDCSGFVTLIYKWSGAPDPNGSNYNGLGYTGTLLEHGVGIPLFQAEPGDLVIWGHWPGHHVAVIVDATNRQDPLIVSHGSEQGPLLLRLSAENSAQNGRSFVIRRYIGR